MASYPGNGLTPGMDMQPDEIFGSPTSGRGKSNRGAGSKKRKKAPQPPQGAGGDEAGTMMRKAQLRLPMLRGIMAPDISHSERVAKTTSTSNKNQSGHDFEEQLQLVTGEDAITFFARHGNNTPVKFVYCNRMETGDEFRPYDMVIADRKKLNPEFFTISSSGVVHVSPNQPSEFVSLADWMHQSTLFNVLRSIRFFKHYLIAKMFRLWRSNVRYRLYCKQRKQLTRSLFLARPSFCAPLLEVNKLMVEMDTIKLTMIRLTVCEASAFVTDQHTQRQNATNRFTSVTDRLEACVEKVCKGVKERARAYDHGVASDDLSNSRFAQHLLGGNGRSKSMVAVKKERAERVRRLKHAALEADMLGDFIRLVDYMEVEHLISITTSATSDFLHSALITVDKADQKGRRGALFQTTVSFGPDNLVFSPTVGDIDNIIRLMIQDMVSTVDMVARVLKIGKSSSISNADQPQVASAINNDRGFGETKAAIKQKIEEDFATIEKNISFLEKHRPVYEFGETWSFEEYKLQEHTVQSIQKDMVQQKEWESEIERIRMLYDAGIFQAETRGLKNHLLPITKNSLAHMKDLLLSIFSSGCTELHSIYHDKIKSIDEDPTHLPVYAKHVELFNQVKEEGVDLYERYQKIEIMHKLLLDHKMKIPSQDAVAYEDLQESVKLSEIKSSALKLRSTRKRRACNTPSTKILLV
jgi:dynein heavy chain